MNCSCASTSACVGGTECIPCAYPLAAEADFWPSPVASCEVNQVAVQSVWGVCAALNMILFIACCPAIYRMFNRVKPKRSRKDFSTFEWRIMFELLEGLFACVLGLLESTSGVGGARSIGLDPLTTVFFAISWQITMINYILAKREKITIYSKVIFPSSRSSSSYIRLFEASVVFQYIYAAFGGYITLFMLNLPNPAITKVVFWMWVVAFALLSTTTVLVAYTVIINELSSSVRLIGNMPVQKEEAAKMTEIRRAVILSRNRHMFAFPMVCVGVVFAFVDAVQPYATYFLCAILIFGAIGCLSHPLRYLRFAHAEDSGGANAGGARFPPSYWRSSKRSELVSSYGG